MIFKSLLFGIWYLCKYRMKQKIAILFFGLMCFSCGIDQKKEEIPSEIIEPQKMKEILWDINLMESNLRRRVDIGEGTKSLQREEDLNFILSKHEVNDSVFDKSYNYYATHPELMKKILEDAIEHTENVIEELENEGDSTK